MAIFHRNPKQRLISQYCEAVSDANLNFGDNKLVLYGGATLFLYEDWLGIKPVFTRRVTDIDFSIFTSAPIEEKQERELKKELNEKLIEVARQSGLEAYRTNQGFNPSQYFFLIRNEEEASVHVNVSGINRMSLNPKQITRPDGTAVNMMFLQPLDHLAFKIARIYKQAFDHEYGAKNPWRTTQDLLDVVNLVKSGLVPIKHDTATHKISCDPESREFIRAVVMANMLAVVPTIAEAASWNDNAAIPKIIYDPKAMAAAIQPFTRGKLDRIEDYISTRLCEKLCAFFRELSDDIFPNGVLTDKEVNLLNGVAKLSGDNYFTTRSRAADELANIYPEAVSMHPELVANTRRHPLILAAMRNINAADVELR